LPEVITADEFAENILGFEEVEEMEENNGDGDMMQQEMMMGSGGMYGNMNGMGYQI
jgi:hypothetical protein